MERILHITFTGLLTFFLLSACEPMPDRDRNRADTEFETASEPVEARVEEQQPATVQEALKADAQLARTMNLEEFTSHMKSRETYYSQFDKVSYEDDFVKIKMNGDELKVETAEGKAKLEEEEGEIKTDKEKRKWEKND